MELKKEKREVGLVCFIALACIGILGTYVGDFRGILGMAGIC